MHKTKVSALIALIVIGLIISVFPVTVSCEPPEVEGWNLTVDGGSIAGNPDLVEYVWTTNRTPYGLYDKIAVHRVLRADGEAGEGVVFLLPGTWSSGEQMIHSRKGGIQYAIPNANRSILLYLATRGFDMYVLDYRTHFVPNTETNLSFMLNWGWDAWMGDIKAAVDLIKTVSGACKIYIGGSSFGGGAAMNYASMYWEEDLKGIILLDPAYCQVAAKRGGETNSFDLPTAIWYMQYVTKAYSSNSSGGPNNPIWAYAVFHPEDTATRAYLMYLLNASGAASPYTYPYSEPAAMFAVMAAMDPYWPSMLGLESVAYMDWTSCPYTYDFDDHFIEIDVPVIGFATKRYWVYLANTIPGFGEFGEIVDGIANPDFTGVRLAAGYGHLDVFAGTYNREDVNEPTYQWLISHRMLVGFGGIRVDRKWNWGKTTIYINLTVIDFKVDGVRVAWNIIDHRIYKNLESYKGEGELGSIAILIYKQYAAATGPKAFFFGQRV